jgi:hypothetical protein
VTARPPSNAGADHDTVDWAFCHEVAVTLRGLVGTPVGVAVAEVEASDRSKVFCALTVKV